MSKYQINYNRKVPDHRVPFDYHFMQKHKNPLDYFKAYKQGFNTSWLKFYPMHLTGVYIVLASGFLCYFMWDSTEEQIYREKRVRYPALYYAFQITKGNRAPYDNILKKFATEPNSLRDQPFEEY